VLKGDIWTANGDGSGRKLLVKNGRAPAWSPDKKQIAFERNGDIWILRLGESAPRRLTSGYIKPRERLGYVGGLQAKLAWEPRSSHIYFSRWEEFLVRRPGERTAKAIAACSLFEVAARSGKPTARLDLLDAEASFHASINANPSFSRDGRFLAFTRNGDVWLAERVKDASGRDAYERRWIPWDMHRLDAAASYDAPNWRGSRWNLIATSLSISPNGRRLVYCKERAGGSGYLSLILVELKNGRSANHRELSEGLRPSFSPDSNWVAYEGRYGAGDWGIHVQNVSAAMPRLIIPAGEDPAW
jgi:Tol biopolymer transport system component